MLGLLSLLLNSPSFAEGNIQFDASKVKTKNWSTGESLGAVGRVEINGPIEVPLFLSDSTKNPSSSPLSAAPFVSVTSYPEILEGEDGNNEESTEKFFFALSTNDSMIVVNDDFISKNNLEVKTINKRLIPVPDDYKIGGEIKIVTIPRIDIGGLHLFDVTAYVSSSESKLSDHDLMIGLDVLDLAYSILPSKGVVRFGPLSEGEKFIEDVGGATLDYNSGSWEQSSFTQSSSRKELKSIRHKGALLTELSIGNTTYPVALSSTDASSALFVPSQSLPPKSPSKFKGDLSIHWLSVQADALELPASWFTAINNPMKTYEKQVIGVIGSDQLHLLDIAVSPSNNKLALNAGTEINYKSIEKEQLDRLRKEIAQRESEEDEISAEEWTSLAEKEFNEHHFDDALLTIQKALALEKEDCTIWESKGTFELYLNDLSAAQASLEQASLLYHGWWDRSLDERLELTKTQNEALEAAESDEEKEELKASGWVEAQSETCKESDRIIMKLELLNNLDKKSSTETLKQSYLQNIDLDWLFPSFTGNAALLTGDLALAQEAYRQAILLEPYPSAANRLGLALYYTDIGEWRFAKPLFLEAMQLDPESSLTLIYYLENARGETNPKALLKWAQRWRAANPNSSAAHYGLVYESKKQDDQRSYEAAVKLADVHFAEHTKGPSYYTHLSTYISYLILVERFEEAKLLLDSIEGFKTSTLSLARAEYAAAMGDSEAADKHLLISTLLVKTNPALTMMLKEEAQASATEDAPANEAPSNETEAETQE